MDENNARGNAMLFRKKIERSCCYCIHGTQMDGEQILCVKKGVVSTDEQCRKFEYDPCKRVPPKIKAINFRKYDDEDYSL